VEWPDPRNIWNDAKQNVPREKVQEKFLIGADADTHINAIQELADAGVTHIYVHSGQKDQRAVIDFYSREVLPHVEHEALAVS
jgi:hypothetical protein